MVTQWIKNPMSMHEDAGSIPGLDQWVKDLALLWLWCRPAAAAPIGPLAWELPYAMGRALKRPPPPKKIGGETPESHKKQNLNLLCMSNYLHNIHIVLGIISHLDVVYSIQEDMRGLHANTKPS